MNVYRPFVKMPVGSHDKKEELIDNFPHMVVGVWSAG